MNDRCDDLIKTFLDIKNSKNVCIYLNFKMKINKLRCVTDIMYVSHNQIKYIPDSITYPTAQEIVNITSFTYLRYKKYLFCDLNYYPELKEEFLITLEKALLL